MWPDIPYPPWRETCAALHLYTQIIGKYRLAHTPWVNHSWHATLYVNARGTTNGQDVCNHAHGTTSFGYTSAGSTIQTVGLLTEWSGAFQRKFAVFGVAQDREVTT